MLFDEYMLSDYMFYDFMFYDSMLDDDFLLYNRLFLNKNREEVKISDDDSEDGYSSNDYSSKLHEDFNY